MRRTDMAWSAFYRVIRRSFAVCAGLTGVAVAAAPAQAQLACEAMRTFSAPDVRITEATAAATPVPLCKVDGVIGTEIRFTLRLPDTWNGMFVMGGQGGFAGRVESQAIGMGALEKGYAVAGTDTGHVGPGGGTDGSWALGNLERVVNYAHAAIHRVTATAKAIVAARYGRAADKAYFAGCSNGGREGLMAAQRYPDDFDAIVAGAPAQDIRGVIATFLTITRVMYPDPAQLRTPILSAGDQEALQKTVLATCDAADGLKDGILADPGSCTIDLKSLACPGANADDCLTPAEIAAVETITKGPMLDGKPYHVGFPYGGEGIERGGWAPWLVGAGDVAGPGRPSLAYGFGLDFLRYFVKQDPAWSYTSFDLSTFTAEMKTLQATLSPMDPDLSAFRKRGGKLLIYHGWSDPALSAWMTTRYFDAVIARDASAADDVRLFMMPGVLHCTGGPGPDRLDVLDAVDRWSRGGPPPTELTVGFASGGGARKLCAHPKTAVFTGSGDGRSPEQFECR
jgi:feruloyl esterase